MARPRLNQYVRTKSDATRLAGAAKYLDSLGDALASEWAVELRKIEKKLREAADKKASAKGGAPKQAWTAEAEREYGTRWLPKDERAKRSRKVFLKLTTRPSSKTEEGQRKLLRNHLKRYNDTLK